MPETSLQGKRRFQQLTDSNLLLLIAVSIFVVLYVFAMFFIGGSFLRWQGFFNLLNNNAALLILACALSIVMIGGGIDISVGGVVALVTAACAVYLDSAAGGNIFVSVCIALGIGLTFGVVQGFLVAYMGVQPFIITLAGMFFARGLATVITPHSHTVRLESFIALRNIRVESYAFGHVARSGNLIPATIDMPVFISLLVVVLVACALKWSKFGRNLYAVGGNPHSALMLGINVKRTRFYSHVICGLLAGISGYLFLLWTGSGFSQHAMIFEMRAIAASIIGGTMLTGGVGNIAGSPVGVLILMTIEAMVRGSGLTAGGRVWLQDVTTGVMLFLALILQSVILSRRGRTMNILGSFKQLFSGWLNFRR